MINKLYYMQWFFLLLILTSCRELAQRESYLPDLDKKDLKNLTSPVETPQKLPLLTDNMEDEAEQKPTPSMLQPVSINVCEALPLKQFIIELARQAKVDLQLDPKIDQHVVFSANKMPLIKVIDSICDLVNLRYKIIGNSIRIERDNPYYKNYNVQSLNLTRSSQNRISTATDVFSHVNGTSNNKNSNDNGSNSEVTVNTNSDFWNELENNLKIILQEGESKAVYSLNKQAGLISVCGTSKHHNLVREYIKKLISISSSQVLIEAKIIEVSLKDQYRSGINWQKIGTRNDLQVSAPFGDMARGNFLDPHSAQNEMISFGATGKTFSAIVNALEEFGVVRTLSSPRLTVMNNQTAILKVAQNQVYFRLNYDKQYNNNVNRESVSVSSDIQTVPIGLVMLVQPSIDLQSGKIILFLRPTISRLSRSVPDPAVNIVYNASITSQNIDSNKLASAKPSMIPVVEVREIDSVLQLQNQELAILGGLMEIRSVQHDTKAPVLGDVPVLKELFSSRTEGDEVVELVILLRATIFSTKQAPKPDKADQRIMNQYTKYPRM